MLTLTVTPFLGSFSLIHTTSSKCCGMSATALVLPGVGAHECIKWFERLRGSVHAAQIESYCVNTNIAIT